MAKRSILMVLFVLLGLTATAQKISVSGIVWDGSADESLPAAQVALLTAKDSTQMAAAVSDAEGKFTIPYMKKGDYILRVTYFGFQVLYKNLTLDKSERKMDLGKLVLKENSKLMKEAEITVNVAKVEVVADTFMYNADAYKLPEGSNLEELVRQIPGAEIDENGGLKINGKSVSKILMKGKEFFSGDTEMALKNLPSKVVQKVKAYDRKSDYSRITGIDDGEEETVLDLTVKRGMGEGWLMNVDAGVGKAVQDKIPNETEQIKFPVPLYTGKVDLNHYDDQLQLTFFGNRNNNNNGAGRWGGYGGGSGVTTTTMVGLNVTWTNGLEKYTGGYMEVGGNVRWNGRESENMTVSNREMFLNNQSSSFSNSRNWNKNKNNNINADLRLEWMVDSLTSIIFRPSFSHSESDGQSRGTSVTFNEDPYQKTTNPLKDFEDDNLFASDETRVNSNKSESHNNSNGNNGNMNLQVNRRLAKPGRNVTVDVNGSFNKNDNESFNWNKINYYQQNRTQLQDRYTMSPSESWHAQGRLSYTEPITEYLNLQFSYQFQRRFSDNDRSMFNLDRLVGEMNGGQPIDEAFLYDIFTNGVNLNNAFAHGLDWQQLSIDALNSQYATYKENNHNAQVLLRFNKRLENDQEIRLNAGLNAQPQHTLMHYEKGSLDTTVTRNTFNWAPRVDFRWKINNVSQFRFGYNARMSQPSMTQLMEVTDDSNPLNVSTGNAGLRSSWNNNVNVEYNGYQMENQMSWFIRANYGNTKNSISSATIYDSNTGARYTRPMNINGNWNANINLNFNTALGEKKYWNIMNNLNVSYNYRLGYLSNNNGGSQLNLHYTPEGTIDMDDLFSQVDLTQFEAATKTTGVTDWLRMNYRKSFGDDWNVDLGANVGGMFNSTRSTSNTASNADTWMFGYGFNATIMFPWSISLRTDITQQSRRGYSDDLMNTNELLWNATLQKSFLKENAATISIEWNDILHQRTNVSRAIDAFSRTDTYTNNINSYFMCHFIYRLNLLGSKEARGMMNGFGFGGGGGNWSGGRSGNGGPGGGRGGFGGGGRF